MSVGLSVTIVSPPAKTAEPIGMPFGMWTWMGLRIHAFRMGVQTPHAKGQL